jgi:hypothetical protein
MEGLRKRKSYSGRKGTEDNGNKTLTKNSQRQERMVEAKVHTECGT